MQNCCLPSRTCACLRTCNAHLIANTPSSLSISTGRFAQTYVRQEDVPWLSGVSDQELISPELLFLAQWIFVRRGRRELRAAVSQDTNGHCLDLGHVLLQKIPSCYFSAWLLLKYHF